MVGRTGLEFFRLANKWAKLGWLIKWPTHGGSDQVTRFDSSTHAQITSYFSSFMNFCLNDIFYPIYDIVPTFE